MDTKRSNNKNRHAQQHAAADFTTTTSSDVDNDDDEDAYTQKKTNTNSFQHIMNNNMRSKNAHNTQNNENYASPPPPQQQIVVSDNIKNASDSSANEHHHHQQTLLLPPPPPPPSTTTRSRSFATLLKQQSSASITSKSNILCNFATGNANVLLMATNNMTQKPDTAAADLGGRPHPSTHPTQQHINYNTRLMQATHDSVLMLHRTQLQEEKLKTAKKRQQHSQSQQQIFSDQPPQDDEQICCSSCCMPQADMVVSDDDDLLLKTETRICDAAEVQQQANAAPSNTENDDDDEGEAALASATKKNCSGHHTAQQTCLHKQVESTTTTNSDDASHSTDRSNCIDEMNEQNDQYCHQQRWLTLAPGGNGAVRVFPPDFNAPCERSQIVPCTMTTPARVICEKFLSIPANALHVQFGSESPVRRLDMHECPLAIQNAFLKRIGFRTCSRNTTTNFQQQQQNDDYHRATTTTSSDSTTVHSSTRNAITADDDEQDVRQLGLSHELTYFVRFYAGKPNKDNTFSRRLLSACLLVSTATKLSAARKLLYNHSSSSAAANDTDLLIMARISSGGGGGGIRNNNGRWQARQCVLSGTRLLVYPEGKTKSSANKTHHTVQPPIVYQLARGDVQVVPVITNAQPDNTVDFPTAGTAWRQKLTTGRLQPPLHNSNGISNPAKTDSQIDIDECSCRQPGHSSFDGHSHTVAADCDAHEAVEFSSPALLAGTSTVVKNFTLKSKQPRQTPTFILKLTTFRPQLDSDNNNNKLLPTLLGSPKNIDESSSSFFRLLSNNNNKKRSSSNRRSSTITTEQQQNYLLPNAINEITAISTSSIVTSTTSSSSSSSTSSAADSALAASVSSTEAANNSGGGGGLIARWHTPTAAACAAQYDKHNKSATKQKSILLGFQTEQQMLRWHARLKRATAKQSHVADLSNNHLEYLPENLFACQEGLIQLNLRNNMLKERPIEEDIFTIGWLDDLPRFTALQSLNLANNELHVFPSSVCRLSQLVELNISSNSIDEVSPAIKSLAKLRILQLHANRLTDLPLELAYLHNLSVLVLSFNRFSFVPQVLASMPQIDSLIINGNRIGEITYDTCSRLRNITKIDLRLNRLRTPPLVQQQHHSSSSSNKQSGMDSRLFLPFNDNNNILRFDLLSGTTHLDLRSNKQLTQLDLQALHQLQYFNASYCSLKTVTLSGTSLLFVDISNNDLQQLLVKPLPNRLISLSLSRNSLAKLPEWAGDIRHLEHLDCSYNCLIGLPQKILHNGYSIRTLYASHNQLHCLPERVENCVLLEELDVAHNRLTTLPEPLLAGSHKLRVLNIAHNRFSLLPLPNAFVDVNRIQCLYASFNALDDRVWEVVRLLPRLRTLHLAHNRLRQCPSRLFENWPSLEELNVSGNFLSALPNDLFLASHLTSLYAHSNNLHRLPDTSQNLRLKHVDLSFNPLEFHAGRNIRRRSEQQHSETSGGGGGVKVHFAQDVVPGQHAHATREKRSKTKAAKTGSEPKQPPTLQPTVNSAEPALLLPMWQCGAAETSGHRARMCITRIKQPAFSMQNVNSSTLQRSTDEAQNQTSALFALIDGGQCAEVPDKVQQLLPTLVSYEWSKLYGHHNKFHDVNKTDSSLRSRAAEKKRRNTLDRITVQTRSSSSSRRCRTRERSSVRHSQHRRSSRRWASAAPNATTALAVGASRNKARSSSNTQYSNHLRKAVLHAHLHLRDAGQRVGASCVVAHIYCPPRCNVRAVLTKDGHYPTNSRRRSSKSPNQRNSEHMTICPAASNCGPYYLATANVGGAEAVISRANGELVPLSQPFRPSTVDAREVDRVCAAGGIITDNDRVNASSQHTRLIGAHFLYPMVIAQPHCSAIELDWSDEFIIIANEAFWLACGHEEAAALVREKLYDRNVANELHRTTRNMSDGRWATQIAKALVDLALCYGGGKSNLSVMVVLLNIPKNNLADNKAERFPSSHTSPSAAEPVDCNSKTASHGGAGPAPVPASIDSGSGGGVGTLRSDGTLFYDSTAYIEQPLSLLSVPNNQNQPHNKRCSSRMSVVDHRVDATPLPTSDMVPSTITTTPALDTAESQQKDDQANNGSSDYGHRSSNQTSYTNLRAATHHHSVLRSSHRRSTQCIQPPTRAETGAHTTDNSQSVLLQRSATLTTSSSKAKEADIAARSGTKPLCHMSNVGTVHQQHAANGDEHQQQTDVDTDASNAANNFLRRHRSSLRVVPNKHVNHGSNLLLTTTGEEVSAGKEQKPETDAKSSHFPAQNSANPTKQSDNTPSHVNGVVTRWKLQRAAQQHEPPAAITKNHHDDDNTSVVYEKVGDDIPYYENIYASVTNTNGSHQPAHANQGHQPAAPPSPPPLPPDARRNNTTGDVLLLAKLKRRKDVLSAAGDAERRAREDKERKQKCLLDELQTVLLRRRLLSDAGDINPSETAVD